VPTNAGDAGEHRNVESMQPARLACAAVSIQYTIKSRRSHLFHNLLERGAAGHLYPILVAVLGPC
jgi:hypothetical protein